LHKYTILVTAFISILLGCDANKGNPNLSTEMVMIPAGEYIVGSELKLIIEICNNNVDNIFKNTGLDYKPLLCSPASYTLESPAIKVQIEKFYIDKFEVTKRDYKICLDDGVCMYNGNANDLNSDLPMTNITWKQAETFCEWRGARLPTEVEWEIAARGNTRRFYTWGNDYSCEKVRSVLCREEEHSSNIPSPSLGGSNPYDKSVFGLMDMSGNVSEITYNRYCSRFPENRNSGNICQLFGPFTSVRGASVNSGPTDTIIDRDIVRINFRKSSIGFRCVRSANP